MQISQLVAETTAEGTHVTLEKVLEVARSFEAVDIQLKEMTSVEEDHQQVNRIE